jgi:hypothetical protein
MKNTRSFRTVASMAIAAIALLGAAPHGRMVSGPQPPHIIAPPPAALVPIRPATTTQPVAPVRPAPIPAPAAAQPATAPHVVLPAPPMNGPQPPHIVGPAPNPAPAAARTATAPRVIPPAPAAVTKSQRPPVDSPLSGTGRAHDPPQ